MLLSCDALIDNLNGNNNKPPQNITYDPVSFSHPKVGQASLYVKVDLENISTPGMTCSEQNDTLLLEVIYIDDNVIELMQITTYDDRMANFDYEFPKDTSYLTIELYEDSIYVTYPVPIEKGPIVVGSPFLWYNSRIPQETTSPITLANSCLPKYFLQARVEFLVDSVAIDDRTFYDVSMFIDNSDMQVDGPGYTFVYSMDEGLIASYVVNPFVDAGNGWKRIN